MPAQALGFMESEHAPASTVKPTALAKTLQVAEAHKPQHERHPESLTQRADEKLLEGPAAPAFSQELPELVGLALDLVGVQDNAHAERALLSQQHLARTSSRPFTSSSARLQLNTAHLNSSRPRGRNR